MASASVTSRAESLALPLVLNTSCPNSAPPPVSDGYVASPDAWMRADSLGTYVPTWMSRACHMGMDVTNRRPHFAPTRQMRNWSYSKQSHADRFTTWYQLRLHRPDTAARLHVATHRRVRWICTERLGSRRQRSIRSSNERHHLHATQTPP